MRRSMNQKTWLCGLKVEHLCSRRVVVLVLAPWEKIIAWGRSMGLCHPPMCQDWDPASTWLLSASSVPPWPFWDCALWATCYTCPARLGLWGTIPLCTRISPHIVLGARPSVQDQMLQGWGARSKISSEINCTKDCQVHEVNKWGK